MGDDGKTETDVKMMMMMMMIVVVGGRAHLFRDWDCCDFRVTCDHHHLQKREGEKEDGERKDGEERER
jgi:hypothetical protein